MACWFAVLVAAQAGCDATCGGLGCERQWAGGRLIVVDAATIDGASVGAPINALDAGAVITGDITHGTDWRAGGSPAALVVGLPDWGRVAVLDPLAPDLDAPMALLVGDVFYRDRAGAAVLVLDANGDGVDDLWVGAPEADFGRGEVRLYLGPAWLSDGDVQPDLVITGGSTGERFGERLTACADLDGDGSPEIAVGVPWFSTPTTGPLTDAPVGELGGAIVLVPGQLARASGGRRHVGVEVGVALWSEQAGAAAGLGVSCRRDLDGDGAADLIVGAPFYGEGAAGRVFVVTGAALTRSESLERASITAVDGTRGQWFGYAIEPLDNGEVAIGLPGAAGGDGGVWFWREEDLFVGSLRPVRRLGGAAFRGTPGHVGRWLASGHLDGDDARDLVVGAPATRTSPDDYETGSAWVLRGGGAWQQGDLADADALIVGAHAFQRAGRALALVDLNGDGRDTLLLPVRAATPR